MKPNKLLAKIEKRVRLSQALRIQTIRKTKQMTQKKLSKKMKISVRTISLYERGLKDFTIEDIESFAKALGVTPRKLIGLA